MKKVILLLVCVVLALSGCVPPEEGTTPQLIDSEDGSHKVMPSEDELPPMVEVENYFACNPNVIEYEEGSKTYESEGEVEYSPWCLDQRDAVCKVMDRMVDNGMLDYHKWFYLCRGPGLNSFVCH